MMINAGLFLSAVMGGAFYRVQSGWRYMFAVPCVVGMIQFIGFVFAPETPRWLISKGRIDDARAVLGRMRDNPDDIEDEIRDIQKAVTEDADSEPEGQNSMVVVRVVKIGAVRRALVLSVCIAIISQVTGIGAVIFYAGTIMKMAGFASGNAVWLTTIPTGVLLVASFISTCFVERMGRKILFVGAVIGLMVSLVVIGLGFYLSSVYSPSINMAISETFDNGTAITECQFRTCDECIHSLTTPCGFCYDDISRGTCLPIYDNGSAVGGRCIVGNSFNSSDFKMASDFCPTRYGWMPVLGSSLHLFAYGAGIGVISIVISEIFPLWARSTCSSVATVTVFISQITVSMTFLSLVDAISMQGAFWLYGGCALLSVIYTCIFMPETGGTTLEDVEKLFMSREECEARAESVQNVPESSKVENLS